MPYKGLPILGSYLNEDERRYEDGQYKSHHYFQRNEKVKAEGQYNTTLGRYAKIETFANARRADRTPNRASPQAPPPRETRHELVYYEVDLASKRRRSDTDTPDSGVATMALELRDAAVRAREAERKVEE